MNDDSSSREIRQCPKCDEDGLVETSGALRCLECDFYFSSTERSLLKFAFDTPDVKDDSSAYWPVVKAAVWLVSFIIAVRFVHQWVEAGFVVAVIGLAVAGLAVVVVEFVEIWLNRPEGSRG